MHAHKNTIGVEPPDVRDTLRSPGPSHQEAADEAAEAACSPTLRPRHGRDPQPTLEELLFHDLPTEIDQRPTWPMTPDQQPADD
jgi:hypothetical protein